MDPNLAVEYGDIYKNHNAQDGGKYTQSQNPIKSWLPPFNPFNRAAAESKPDDPRDMYHNQNDDFETKSESNEQHVSYNIA